jgi:oligosaccharide repeat unit polymerase
MCLGCFVAELLSFRRRFGVGGMTLFGGMLVWYCYDYLRHWAFSPDYLTGLANTREVVAKHSYYICLSMVVMIAGLNSRRGAWADRFMQRIPEVRDSQRCFWIMLAIFAVGISPYFFFTAEPFYMAIYHQIFAGRGATTQAQWIGGRSGNVNYNWAGYVAQILSTGQIGAIYAIFYVVLLARKIFAKLVGWFIWVLWFLLGFGTGTRGEIVAMVMPLLFVLFIKYHSLAKRLSMRAYMFGGVLVVVSLLVIQIQITFRNAGFQNADISSVNFMDFQGNAMFSEGLPAMRTIPDEHDFFFNHYYIEGLVRPIPDTVYWALIGPIPRALWTSKPVDPVWVWYNQLSTGEANGATGTTIASGLVSGWYMRYGLFGVLEGGLLVGWLMGVGERALQHSGGRLNLLLLSLGWEVWLFRAYRGLGFSDLYALLIGVAVLGVISMGFNLFGGASEPQPAAAGAFA